MEKTKFDHVLEEIARKERMTVQEVLDEMQAAME